MNKHNNNDAKNRQEPQVELESQFILRLPAVSAIIVVVVVVVKQ